MFLGAVAGSIHWRIGKVEYGAKIFAGGHACGEYGGCLCEVARCRHSARAEAARGQRNDSMKRQSPVSTAVSCRCQSMSAGSLSGRECEVLRLFARGLTLRAVAAELRISVASADTYCRRIYQKLGVHSKAEAVYRFFGVLCQGSGVT